MGNEFGFFGGRTRFLEDYLKHPSSYFQYTTSDGIDETSTVESKDDHLVISIDLPGVEKNAINITNQKNELIVRAHRKDKDGQITRYVDIDTQTYDVDNIKAKLDLGVLTITVPIRKSSLPKKIVVE